MHAVAVYMFNIIRRVRACVRACVRAVTGRFPNLAIVSGSVEIFNCHSLASLAGAFPSLRRCRAVVLNQLLALVSLGDAFRALRHVDDVVAVRSCRRLDSLGTSFAQLLTANEIELNNNYYLRTFGTAFGTLENVTQALGLYGTTGRPSDAPSLTISGAFPSLRRAGRIQFLPEFGRASQMRIFRSFARLEIITGGATDCGDTNANMYGLRISGGRSGGYTGTTSVTESFAALERVRGGVWLQGRALSDLTGSFTVLRTVEGVFRVMENPELNGFDGSFAGVANVTCQVDVYGNGRGSFDSASALPSLVCGFINHRVTTPIQLPVQFATSGVLRAELQRC